MKSKSGRRRAFAISGTENTRVETTIGVSQEADAPECETASSGQEIRIDTRWPSMRRIKARRPRAVFLALVVLLSCGSSPSIMDCENDYASREL